MSTETPTAARSEAAALRQRLTRNGIDVERLDMHGRTPALVFAANPDAERLQQVVTVALVVARHHASAVDDLLTVTVTSPTSSRQVGSFYLNRRVIDQFREGSLDKQAYASEVAATYRDRDG